MKFKVIPRAYNFAVYNLSLVLNYARSFDVFELSLSNIIRNKKTKMIQKCDSIYSCSCRVLIKSNQKRDIIANILISGIA